MMPACVFGLFGADARPLQARPHCLITPAHHSAAPHCRALQECMLVCRCGASWWGRPPPATVSTPATLASPTSRPRTSTLWATGSSLATASTLCLQMWGMGRCSGELPAAFSHGSLCLASILQLLWHASCAARELRACVAGMPSTRSQLEARMSLAHRRLACCKFLATGQTWSQTSSGPRPRRMSLDVTSLTGRPSSSGLRYSLLTAIVHDHHSKCRHAAHLH